MLISKYANFGVINFIMNYTKLSSITDTLDRIDQERTSNPNSRTYLHFDIAGHGTI